MRESGPHKKGRAETYPDPYFEGGVLPLTGGHGTAAPGAPGAVDFACAFPDADPEVEPVVPVALEDPVEPLPPVVPLADDPALAAPELDVPVFGCAAPGVPGKFPQGELLGEVPGVVFGFIVDGCVVFPVVGGFVEFAPGTGAGVVGVAVLPGGVAVPGVLDPVVPGLPGGCVAPDGAFCATTQTAQARNKKRKVSFAADIRKASCSKFLVPLPAGASAIEEFATRIVCITTVRATHREDAVERPKESGSGKREM